MKKENDWNRKQWRGKVIGKQKRKIRKKRKKIHLNVKPFLKTDTKATAGIVDDLYLFVCLFWLQKKRFQSNKILRKSVFNQSTDNQIRGKNHVFIYLEWSIFDQSLFWRIVFRWKLLINETSRVDRSAHCWDKSDKPSLVSVSVRTRDA